METLTRRINTYQSSFFLFGPRGTGKTTWLKTNFPNARHIDLLRESEFRKYSSRPERLEELIDGDNSFSTIVIDEVQRIPELLNTVHRLIENNKSLQFILTGSSSRKLKRSGVDLLAGRAVLKRMYPFIASELGKLFHLEKALTMGMVPLITFGDNPEKNLETYSALYLKEEVQMEGLVRNVGTFSRFMEIMSFSHGQIINYSEIARECETGRKAVENYIQILEDLLLARQISVFSKRAKRQMVKHKKFYYFDAGVFHDLRPKGPLDRSEEIAGQALEGLVLQHLLAWNEYDIIKGEVYFWRTKSGQEVDFIVYGENIFWAIEVKNTGTIRKKELSGLQSFLRDYPQASAVLLYRGEEQLMIDGVLCLPITEFLLNEGSQLHIQKP